MRPSSWPATLFPAASTNRSGDQDGTPVDLKAGLGNRPRLDIARCRIVATDGPEDSAHKAATAAGVGEVAALMKGGLHTDVFLHTIMQKEAKLLAGRLISHCVMVSVPT